MRKFLAWIGFRRFVPNCRLCEWTDHNDDNFRCDAQAGTAAFAVYGSDDCYRVYKQIPSTKEVL